MAHNYKCDWCHAEIPVDLVKFGDMTLRGGLSAMSTPRKQMGTCDTETQLHEYESAECVNWKGVTAPLEPTARDKDIEQLEQQRERVGQEFGHVRWTEAEKQPDGSYTAKLSGERFLAQQGFADSRNYSATELGPLLEAYAAAVSKNLRQELAESQQIARTQQGLKELYLRQAEAAETRILELEKEIAALPKDGRWNAALDKAAEMLSRMEVIAGQPRATVEKAVVEIRKLKEITALRETK